jgi:hypothetical protein
VTVEVGGPTDEERASPRVTVKVPPVSVLPAVVTLTGPVVAVFWT